MKFNLLSIIHAFIFGLIVMGVITGYNREGIIWGTCFLIVSFFANLEDYIK